MSETFTNQVINISDLPSLDDVQYTHVSPKYRWVTALSMIIFSTILLIVYLVVGWLAKPVMLEMPVIAIVLGLYIILSLAWLWLVFKSYAYLGYALREHDILIREGILFKSLIAVPYNRVQHCEIYQGALSRFLGLATISIHTAGGSGSELSIDGIDHDIAHHVRQLISSKTNVNDARDQQ